ncbi:MAG: importin-alpha export receptor [Cirrosporium novae-zelandiae]|nr:MAG: importin-alpha export receptor [Cirrosporium novae-zelandiae]
MATGDLEAVAQLLQATLDPAQNKKAELAIRQEEKNPGFSLTLLQLTASDAAAYTTRLAAALCFKNLIRRHWTDGEGNHLLPQNEVAAIKHEIIGLMISVPAGIQSQLGDAISVIADSDFFTRWDTLMEDLASRLSADDLKVNNGVLGVAHSIFKRWRPLVRTDALYIEIIHVLEKFGPSVFPLLQSTDAIIEQNKDNKQALQQAFANLNLLIKILYDLSCQEIPPLFEDNIDMITKFLLKYLLYNNALLHTDDETEAGELEFVKAGIFELLTLWIQKYEDVVGTHVGQFIQDSWNLLTTIGPETKFDILVSKALQFLTAIAHILELGQVFSDENVLGQVVENVLVPNVSLRESDMEMFEDEPIEFIRRDLEGSDSETRRKAATDFLKQLLGQFQQTVTKVVTKYVDLHLSDYAKNPTSNWKSKDIAIYLFSSIAATGYLTTRGVSSTNNLVDIIDFFQKNIAKDLVADTGVEPILKVSALKYLYTFRSQMTASQWQDAFPLLVKHLGSSNYVIYTYAAIALEKALRLNDEDNAHGQTSQALISPLAKDLLGHIFQLIEKDSAPEKIQENEFLMRCVMRVLIVIREKVLSLTDEVLGHLISITEIIGKNPSNPGFYYYHFEAVGALIRFASPSMPDKLETALYSPFATILQEDVAEFMPYVFQLFAALLEANPSSSLPSYYQTLIAPILTPTLWESKGNVPALVRLLNAIISRGAVGMEQNNQLEPILGIFQKLLSTRTHESHAFELLECVTMNFSASALQKYFVTVCQLILMRLQNSKTDTLTFKFVHFYHVVSSRDDKGLGADFFINAIEQVQEKVFTQVYLSIILPETQKLLRPLDRKTAVVSLTHTLATSAAFNEKYQKGWGFTCEALLKLLELPPILERGREDTIAEHDVDAMSFGVGFTPLATCQKAMEDPWPEIKDPKTWIGQYLKEANGKSGGRIDRLVQSRLSPQARNVLVSYMK